MRNKRIKLIILVSILVIIMLCIIYNAIENMLNKTANLKQALGEKTIELESLVQGFIANSFANGDYTVKVKDEEYDVEVINYYDDVTYSLDAGETSKTVSLGDNTTEYKMLIVKYHGNLTINKGVTVTATTVNNLTYKKGMYICVLGNLVNNGTITMTARGTYNCEGQNVYLWKNEDDTYEYVPAVGAKGGNGKEIYYNVGAWSCSGGNNGSGGNNRATGGGRWRCLCCICLLGKERIRKLWNFIFWRSWWRWYYLAELTVYVTLIAPVMVDKMAVEEVKAAFGDCTQDILINMLVEVLVTEAGLEGLRIGG